ncbi:MAG TPA: C45 family peptidase [Acidimicrobiales bacterium]|nr:C45 family peptidase [Acidimicrobiales bacterium]
MLKRVQQIVLAEADPFRRGHTYGTAVAERVQAVWLSYRELFSRLVGIDEQSARRFGSGTLDALAAKRPAIASEIEGVAAGCELDPEVVAALNARTELVFAAECATVGRVRGPEGPWLSQNWDWYTDAPERAVVVTCDPGPAEHRYVTFTEAGLLAKVGVNDAGLALALDIMRHASDNGQPTASPVHVLLREVLASCATVDDVADLLGAAEPSASSCFAVVTADGDGACFEVTPSGVARIAPDDDGLVHHTNHFLDPDLAEGDRVIAKHLQSCERHDLLVRRRPATVAAGRVALSDHSSEIQPICRHDEVKPGLPPTGTAAYIALDPVSRTLSVGMGPTCRAEPVSFTVPGT